MEKASNTRWEEAQGSEAQRELYPLQRKEPRGGHDYVNLMGCLYSEPD